MILSEQLDYLYNLERFGIAPGLDRLRAVLRELGDPQVGLRAVHIAGTNGKGSVAAMVESMLRSAGYTTGFHISPHLYHFTERMQINREPVSEAVAIALIDRVRAAVDAAGVHLTFTEFTTTMALQHFADVGVDWAVIEVAMGGLHDATNVVDGEIAVVTNIGHDHMEFLGDSLRDITREKAGIIKRGATVVVGEREPELLALLTRISEQRRALLLRSFDEVQIEPQAADWHQQMFRARGVVNGSFLLSLVGAYQLDNVGVALTVIDALRRREVVIPDAAVRTGLQRVVWEGRLEVVREQPLIVVDGAHNPEGFHALAQFVKTMTARAVLVVGVKAGRDVAVLRDEIVPQFDQVITTEGVYKPEAADVLAQALRAKHTNVEAIPDAREAIQRGLKLAGSDGGMLVAGSLYMIPEALAYLKHREVASPLIP